MRLSLRFVLSGTALGLSARAHATQPDNVGIWADPLDRVYDGNLGADWYETAVASPTITLAAPARELLVTLDARIVFGPYEFLWSQGPYTVHASTTVQEPLEIPADAYLHELQTDYVSDLWVRIHVVEALDGRNGEESLVYGQVVWADGVGAPPVVFTLDEAHLLAPNGTLDASVQASSSKYGENVRMYPPGVFEEVPGHGPVEDPGDRQPVTVAVDDQSDEEVDP